VSAAALASAAGFAQFGVAAALSDVAAAFGEPQPELGLTDVAGLSGTALGIGLSLIRLASLGALPLGALGDRFGRRAVLLSSAGVGLLVTALAALSPSYVWFVVMFAVGRPFLSAVNALAIVFAAEETPSHQRARAVALIGAAYGFGAGLLAVIRGAAEGALGFRGLFALALVPLVLVPLIGRRLEETDRFKIARAEVAPAKLGWVPGRFRRRLVVACTLTAAIGFVSGPANSFLFFFGESVKGLSAGAMALAVVASAPLGIGGLVVGRWIADHRGRRIAAGAALTGIAAAAVLTYSLGGAGVLVGYPIGLFFAGAYAPAAGSLNAELFPTEIRATTAGWLTASNVLGAVAGILTYGLLVDALQAFGVAMAFVAAPVVVASVLYRVLPETRGLELEQSYI
jgi:putative MFS transporter